MKTKTKKRAAWMPEWIMDVLEYGAVVRGKDKLVFAMTSRLGLYRLLALETDATSPDGVLDSHAHEWLGDFEDRERARACATRYAKTWWTKKVRAEKCACKPIGKKAARRERA
jgi:hypothetical protein